MKSNINRIAILLTVFNRKEKTIDCLNSINAAAISSDISISVEVFLTDDGSTDDTQEAIEEKEYLFPIHILKGTGSLYWNAGMNNSWQEAIKAGGFDGYLWMNNDTVMLGTFWDDLLVTDSFCRSKYGKGGIYVGSTRDNKTKEFSYGGFNFEGRWLLKDRFLLPTGTPQVCQCGHGNITYVSADVCKKMGILYSGYIHGGGDHDYTYTSYRAGFPVLVMPNYEGECVNDHDQDGYADFMNLPLKKRLEYMNSPFGFNLHNTLIFQKRCFPHRYPFVWLMGHMKAFFPKIYMRIYKSLRR